MIRYSIGHRPELAQNLVIKLGEGLTGTAAASRETILVGDVRNDERYLSSLDAVRTELAAPMIARGKLVGVIDLQCTRVDAFSEYEKSLLRLIASRIAFSIDNARLYRRVDRQNRTLRTLAKLSQEFSSILALDELLGQIAGSIHELINYDAFSIPAARCGTARAAPPLQRALRRARGTRQHPGGQGHHGRGRGDAPGCARRRHVGRSALHCVASRHPLRSRSAAGGAREGDWSDGHRERAHRPLHRRGTCARFRCSRRRSRIPSRTHELYEELAEREKLLESDFKAAAQAPVLVAGARRSGDCGPRNRYRPPRRS